MAFDFFKRKKKKDTDERPDYDVTNLRVTDLRAGFMLDYDFKTWLVKEEYEYDWGDFFFSYEYRLVAEDDEVFLSVEDDDGLTLTLSQRIKAARLDPEIFERIEDKGKPPRKISYDGMDFFREKESPGFFRDTAKQSREQSAEFVAWEYFNEDETRILTIEQWDEDEFEVSVGKVIEEDELSNFLPGEQS